MGDDALKAKLGWLLLASLCWVSMAVASPMDEESKEIFARLIQTHAASVVRVSFVIKSSYLSQEERQESATMGVVVDERGLILVPRMVVEPVLPGVDKLTAEQRAGFKLETSDFRVYFAGQDTPLDAEALSADADLGVAWLRIKSVTAKATDASEVAADKPTRSFTAIDLNDGAAAAPGQAYYVIERMEDRYGATPIINWGVVIGEARIPRPVYIVTGALGLGLSGEGKVLGFAIADVDGFNSGDSTSSSAGVRMTMASAKRLASATQRAASLLESE